MTSVFLLKVANEECVEVMDIATKDQVVGVKLNIESIQEEFDLVAKMISDKEVFTQNEVEACYESVKDINEISSVSIMLSTGQMITSSEGIKISEALEYAKEVMKVPYLSDLYHTEDGKKYCYYGVPVSDGTVTKGILYGVIDFDVFGVNYPVKAYDDMAKLYVIDGNNRSLLISTADSKDVVESSDIGANFNIENFALGGSGDISYLSPKTGEKYCAYYKPLGIKDWMVVLTIPENVAFRPTHRLLNIILYLALTEFSMVMVYLIWILHRTKKDALKQKLQLEQSEYMFKVQQILFGAHKNPELIIRALESVANMLDSQYAFLVASDGVVIKELYYWSPDSEGATEEVRTLNINKTLPDMTSMLVKGKSVMYYTSDKTVMVDKTDKGTLKEHSLKSIMMVPAIDATNRMVGVIGVANMHTRWEDAIMLECIVRNFVMALTNLKSYRMVKKMGAEDALTGLLNRNSYQVNLREYSYSKSRKICCIYMDVNGLHELNNAKGHKAGDDMLKYIGQHLLRIFGKANSYRVGGDEFVVLCRDFDKEKVDENIYIFMKNMMEKNYHISIGVAWRHQHSTFEETVATAEQRMYEDKRTYYRSIGRGEDARI